MRSHKLIALFFGATIATASIAAQQETPIPRSMADKGKYFLLEKKKTGNIVRALHKRVGVDSIGYTRTETNCTTMKMRELALQRRVSIRHQRKSNKVVRVGPWLKQERPCQIRLPVVVVWLTRGKGDRFNSI